MNSPQAFDRIFYPSDFTPESQVAFAHGLKIAMQSKSHLQMMHVDTTDEADWDHFPSVQDALERWKVLPTDSSRDQVGRLGLDVTKMIASSKDPVQACLDFFDVNDVDLIVLSVHQRDGLMRWLGTMVGERISAGSKQNTLFIPIGQKGFVSLETGEVTLKNILVPVVKKPRPESSIEFVQRLTQSLELESGSVTLLHVGSSDTMPFVKYPLEGGWKWNCIREEGDRTETIVKVAKNLDADLIVMTTDGPDRFLDGLRGTTSERVLRRAHCPIVVIPIDSITE